MVGDCEESMVWDGIFKGIFDRIGLLDSMSDSIFEWVGVLLGTWDGDWDGSLLGIYDGKLDGERELLRACNVRVQYPL